MNDSWRKILIWTKLSLLGVVLLFLAIFIGENYSQSADVWLFGHHTMSVLELLVATFLFGVAVALLARPAYRTLRQISELRKKPDPAPLPLAPTPPDAAPKP
jgi:multisubunit Na+/H+ antiporter MnhG subunit